MRYGFIGLGNLGAPLAGSLLAWIDKEMPDGQTKEEWKGMAEAHYAQIAPHLYCGPVEGAANVQLSACTPNFLILESIQDWGGFHAQILKKPIRFEQGFVIPPSEPGLGVELDEAVALAHPYDDKALHLEPAEEPMDFN